MGRTLYITTPTKTVGYIKDLKERRAEQENGGLGVKRKGSDEVREKGLMGEVSNKEENLQGRTIIWSRTGEK